MRTTDREDSSMAGLFLQHSLSVDEQLNILEMARHQIREKETDYRKASDEWHKLGASETAIARANKANALGEAVLVLLEVEKKYRNAKESAYV
jgi:hypothetical protein